MRPLTLSNRGKNWTCYLKLEITQLKSEKHKALIAQAVNHKVKENNFLEGSLILRHVEGLCRTLEEGKLEANWEGPFRIRQGMSNGAYKLKTVDERVI